MKKLFVSVILILLVAILAIWFFKAPIMSIYLSRKLKAKVSIRGVEIKKSRVKVKDLKIHNPPGFKNVPAFSCKEMIISYDKKALKGRPSVIERIDLTDCNLRVECLNALCSDNNWIKIMKNIGEKEAKEEDREVIIRTLAMKRLNVDIHGMRSSLLVKRNTYIDYIEFQNISSKEGFPTNELIIAIFKRANIFDLIKGILDSHKIFDNYFKSLNPFGQGDKMSLDGIIQPSESL